MEKRKKEKSPEENEKLCKGCDSKCCKYVATEIDAPENLEDFEAIKWYVCHEKVNVFVDEDNEWYLEFLTPCKHLDENDYCKIYEKRPQVCRDYKQDECLFHNDDYEEKYTFKKIEDVEKYIEEVFNKGFHELPDEDYEEEEEEDDDEEKIVDEDDEITDEEIKKEEIEFEDYIKDKKENSNNETQN